MNAPEQRQSPGSTGTTERKPLRLVCRQLPRFAADDLETVQRGFQDAQSCAMWQGWRENEEADFAPAMVRTGWRDASLLVFAELTDADIFSRASRLNERLWELGDSFEIFLRPVEQAAYVEFQVAPNNQRLQLRFADDAAVAQARASGSVGHALVPGEALRSTTWLRPGARRWFVFAEIPAKSVCDHARPLNGSQWRFSFSRYDYTRGLPEPVISSTSPHAKADFHRQADWGMIEFQI